MRKLKTEPGYWNLQLREGPSADIYKIDSHSNTNGESEDGQTVEVTLDSFTSKVRSLMTFNKSSELSILYIKKENRYYSRLLLIQVDRKRKYSSDCLL